MKIHLLAATWLGGIVILSGHASMKTKTYDVEDAYQIYSVLLPREESYRFAESTLVIQQETEVSPHKPEECVTAAAADRFKEAILDYASANGEKWLLQRGFHIEKPYQIVSTNDMKPIFKDGGWKAFYKHYKDSGGYIVMSAVGFNQEHNRAIVYMGSACGQICGQWQLHLLEKVEGQWKPVPGVTCITQS
jgi:hypothetical protein